MTKTKKSGAGKKVAIVALLLSAAAIVFLLATSVLGLVYSPDIYTTTTDCDDTNPNVHPLIDEPACDADLIDNDCDGKDAPPCAKDSCGPAGLLCRSRCSSYGYSGGYVNEGDTCYCLGPTPENLLGCGISNGDCRVYNTCVGQLIDDSNSCGALAYGKCDPVTGAWTGTSKGDFAFFEDSSCSAPACNEPPTCSTNPSGCNDGSLPELQAMAYEDKCDDGKVAHCAAECKNGKFLDSLGVCGECASDSDCKDLHMYNGLTLNMVCSPKTYTCTWAANVPDPFNWWAYPPPYYCDDRSGFDALFDTDALGNPAEGGRAYCTTHFGGEGSFAGGCIPTSNYYYWESGAPERLSYSTDDQFTVKPGRSPPKQAADYEMYKCVNTQARISSSSVTATLLTGNDAGESSTKFLAHGEQYAFKFRVRDDDGDLYSPGMKTYVGIASAGTCPGSPVWPDWKADATISAGSTEFRTVSINNPNTWSQDCSCTNTWVDPRDSVTKCTVMECTTDALPWPPEPSDTWPDQVKLCTFTFYG